jgi:hypothetical protein
MKKLFFSAVALVAFSSISFANTSTEEKPKGKELSEKKLVGDTETCYMRASYYLEIMDPYGCLPDTTANDVYQNYYLFCMTFIKYNR